MMLVSMPTSADNDGECSADVGLYICDIDRGHGIDVGCSQWPYGDCEDPARGGRGNPPSE